MSVALCLRFDEKTAELVERLWRELANSGVSSDMLELGYPPHLTLVISNDDVSVDERAPWLARLADEAPEVVVLGAVRTFPGTQVVYLGCEGDLGALRRVQMLAAADLPVGAIDAHYRPESWIPHVTLQTSGDVARALAVVEAHRLGPIAAVPVRLDLLTFPPIAVRTGVEIGPRRPH